MLRERDKLLGVAPAAARPQTRRLIAILLAAGAVAAAFFAGRSSSPGEHGVAEPEARVSGKVQPSSAPERLSAAPGAQIAAVVPARAPEGERAEFLITDTLLADPPSYEALEAEAVSTYACIGETLRIANVSSRRVALIDTPESSDASVSLGFLNEGAVFTLRPQETGTFFISEPDSDGLLFRYTARRCGAARKRR